MKKEIEVELFASQMAGFAVSVGILRTLVDQGVIAPSDAGRIVRDAVESLPKVSNLDWKAVLRKTYEKVADGLEARGPAAEINLPERDVRGRVAIAKR